MSYSNQTTYSPRHTNHLLHLMLSFASCGMWLPVWACVALYNALTKEKTRTVTQGYSPYVGQYRPEAVYPPYAVGPGEPVSAMNPAPPTPGVGTPPMPRTFGVGQNDTWQKAYPPRAYINTPRVPLAAYCQHQRALNLACEDCARPASFPQ